VLEKISSKIFCQKTTKFRAHPKKMRKSSKIVRKNMGLLRMEIFEGTYMRPRYSPYQFPRGQANGAELGLFCLFSVKLGYSIIVSMQKNRAIFYTAIFEKKQPRLFSILTKYSVIQAVLTKRNRRYTEIWKSKNEPLKADTVENFTH